MLINRDKLNDSQVWSDAADRLEAVICSINKGTTPDCFNFIALHNVYLLTSFLYYHYNESVISDITFDKLCKYLLDNFDRE